MTKTREERIAEWLGEKIYYSDKRKYPLVIDSIGGYRITGEWLASAEGERAMMDRIQGSGYGITLGYGNIHGYGEIKTCSFTKRSFYYKFKRFYRNIGRIIKGFHIVEIVDYDPSKYWYGNGKTRNEALQNAILQMLGKGE